MVCGGSPLTGRHGTRAEQGNVPGGFWFMSTRCEEPQDQGNDGRAVGRRSRPPIMLSDLLHRDRNAFDLIRLVSALTVIFCTRSTCFDRGLPRTGDASGPAQLLRHAGRRRVLFHQRHVRQPKPASLSGAVGVRPLCGPPGSTGRHRVPAADRLCSAHSNYIAARQLLRRSSDRLLCRRQFELPRAWPALRHVAGGFRR